MPTNKNKRGISHTDRELVYRRDGFRCQSPFCKSWQQYSSEHERRRTLTIHHIVPKSLNGENEPWNYVTLCWKCHCDIEHHPGLQWAAFRRNLFALAERRRPAG